MVHGREVKAKVMTPKVKSMHFFPSTGSSETTKRQLEEVRLTNIKMPQREKKLQRSSNNREMFLGGPQTRADLAATFSFRS